RVTFVFHNFILLLVVAARLVRTWITTASMYGTIRTTIETIPYFIHLKQQSFLSRLRESTFKNTTYWRNTIVFNSFGDREALRWTVASPHFAAHRSQILAGLPEWSASRSPKLRNTIVFNSFGDREALHSGRPASI